MGNAKKRDRGIRRRAKWVIAKAERTGEASEAGDLAASPASIVAEVVVTVLAAATCIAEL